MGESVAFPSHSPKYKLEGYLARPTGAGTFPGVVIIHEIYGLNENIKDIADRFAQQGYIALAVDLFAGRNKTLCMMQVMGDILFKAPSKKSGVADLQNSLDFLLQQPDIDRVRIGAIGFCMGGHYALAWGCSDARLKVIAPYYGMNPKPLATVQRSCPVVASYPVGDFSARDGHKLETALKQYNIAHDLKFYPDSKHSFFNDKGPNYSATAAQDSWQRVLTFFEQHLAIKSTADKN